MLPSVTSLKALRELASAGSGAKKLTGYGDPVFQGVKSKAGEPPIRVASIRQTRAYAAYFRGAQTDLDALRSGLPALPETADELKSVATRLGVPESEMRLGKAASGACGETSQARRLSHSLFRHAWPCRRRTEGAREPALAFTLPAEATDKDDGLLTASEVAQLKLAADWVVLRPAIPRRATARRRGISGLARAFLYAGARAILVSHRPVCDRCGGGVSPLLRLGSPPVENPEIGRAEALRRASCRGDGERRRSDALAHPSAWAPFVVVGEGGVASQ